MGHENSEKRNDYQLLDCQLQTLYDSTEDLDFADKLRRMYLRLKPAGRRRIAKARKTLFRVRQEKLNGFQPNTFAGNKPVLQEGDVVGVLPFDDIRKTLDENGRLGNMLFMEGMKRYCGRRLRVLKKMKMMLDEHPWGMVRLKDSVILENAICDAKGTYDKEGCNKCCFYFWKEQWLRKVDE